MHFTDSALVDYNSAPNNDASEFVDPSVPRPSQLPVDIQKPKQRLPSTATPLSYYSENSSAIRKNKYINAYLQSWLTGVNNCRILLCKFKSVKFDKHTLEAYM